MKKSEFLKIVREEIHNELREFYGAGQMMFTPSGFEQMNNNAPAHNQRYDNHEEWKIVAMQLGAIIKDRGDDWVAYMPDQSIIGKFVKSLQYGTLKIK
jgi:hypothetical protein